MTDSNNKPTPVPSPELVEKQLHATNDTAAKCPFNHNKAAEYGDKSAHATEGQHFAIPPLVSGSTLSEANVNAKTGAGLAPHRVVSDGQHLTTNQGVPIADNQSSLKAGFRGPALLQDFILREKITAFDHERIPERIVHARGSAAHGFFEAYEDSSALTMAAPFAAKGKITPMFVRFSTVAGERGSFDTARDVRGFAMKFYTDQGNWDLVGNNIPVFFIQDAMKFPDLVHAVKPEPHNGMPQAGSAHDTFWDFVSLMPESTHTLMWAMSDRAIPRSLRMMEGFGVHTYRLVNAEGVSHFVKFHLKPKLGTHALVWDEAVKIQGADSDYHRKDLWDAIESGEYPEWEFGFQTFTEEQAEKWSFDILDPTKLVPEELVPVKMVGRMVLNRNPDNFFAETEQVAFCTAHVIPGIDFSNDPLLAGRIHSYVDTQITRLGSAKFHEIPINAPIVPVHNYQRDGIRSTTIPRGRVAYEPNSLGGGCPFQTGSTAGFVTFPEPLNGDQVRGKPEKFAEHYEQAKLFWNSQDAVQQGHIAAAFRFELSKVTVPAIRERMVAGLRNVSDDLAKPVAKGLGIATLPDPLPKATEAIFKPEVTKSKALAVDAVPGDGGIRTRQIAIVIANGVDGETVNALVNHLKAAHAVPKLIAPHLGAINTLQGGTLEADATLENAAPVLFDAVVFANGKGSVAALQRIGMTREYLINTFRHCKTLMAIGDAVGLLDHFHIPKSLPNQEPDAGLQFPEKLTKADLHNLVTAIAAHRHPSRDMDPPLV
jgi:catalase